MKIKTLEHWKGILGIVMAAGGPWGAWAASGAQLGLMAMLGVVIPSALAGMGALSNLLDDSIAQAKSRRMAKEQPKDPTE